MKIKLLNKCIFDSEKFLYAMKECRRGSFYVNSWWIDITLKNGETINLECVKEEEADKCIDILMKIDNITQE